MKVGDLVKLSPYEGAYPDIVDLGIVLAGNEENGQVCRSGRWIQVYWFGVIRHEDPDSLEIVNESR